MIGLAKLDWILNEGQALDKEFFVFVSPSLMCVFTPVCSVIHLSSRLSAALINSGCVAMVAGQW